MTTVPASTYSAPWHATSYTKAKTQKQPSSPIFDPYIVVVGWTVIQLLVIFPFPEEEKKEGEEEAPKAEEAGEGEAKPEGGEEQPKEDGEAAGGAEVTVEVDIEQGEDKG